MHKAAVSMWFVRYFKHSFLQHYTEFFVSRKDKLKPARGCEYGEKQLKRIQQVLTPGN